MNADNPAVPGATGPYASPAPTVANPQAASVPPTGSPAAAPSVSEHPQQRTGHHQAQPASAAQPAATTQPASASPYGVPVSGQWTQGAVQASPSSASTSGGGNATGEAPMRASLRTGTQTTGLHPTVPAESAAPIGVAGMLKGLGRLVRRKEKADPTTSVSAVRKAGGPRRVRAMLTTVDPWSVMKLAFLLSIAAGIMFVVATAIVWSVLNNMGVFVAIDDQITTIFGAETKLNLLKFFDRNKILSVAILLSVVNALLMTGLATIGAMLYNLVVKLVGGVYVTLTDE
jgi:hypothetical protein